MFMKYKHELKILLREYSSTYQRTFILSKLPFNRNVADYLAAKGLVEITPFAMNYPDCQIRLSDKSLVYFDEKADKLFRFWIPTIISIISLIGAYRQEIFWLLQVLMKSQK